MKTLLLSLCAASVAVSCSGGDSAPEAVVIEMTGNDLMKYDKEALTVEAGASVTVKLTNIGTMPKDSMAHNFILLASGVTAMDFGGACAQPDSGANAENSYIPTREDLAGQMLAYTTTQAGPEETVEVTFTAPEEKGTYEYVCTFPGHFVMMRGVLTVE